EEGLANERSGTLPLAGRIGRYSCSRTSRSVNITASSFRRRVRQPGNTAAAEESRIARAQRAPAVSAKSQTRLKGKRMPRMAGRVCVRPLQSEGVLVR